MNSKQKPDQHEKPDKPFHIIVDQKPHDWSEPFITGAQIKQLASVDPNTYDAWQDVPGPEDRLIGDSDRADLTPHGTERFFTGKRTTTEGYA
ncbi:MAG TPA: multiubiquitin domain-containing protein [Myxococcota bacterium]|nr:multiubiquitin domain-containing protein [Myxococcota bacterium]